MKRKRLLWQLYPSYLIIIVISLVAITWYGSNSFRQFSLRHTAADLEARGVLKARFFIDLLRAGNPEEIQQSCQEQGRISSTRFTLMAVNGQVLGDSEYEPAQMDNHGDRPEVKAALREGRGEAIRYSYTLGQNMMYVAIPLSDNGTVLGVLRLSIPITSIEQALNTVYSNIAMGGLVVAVLAAVVSFFASRRISRPLEQMRLTAKRFAAGELTQKLPDSGITEIGSLATSMNRMAEQLHEKMQAIVNQRNELEAVLSSMMEGVFAVDTEARVLNMNSAAAKLFAIRPGKVQERTIHESVRHPALLEFVDQVLATRKSDEAEISVFDKEERFIQVNGTVLSDSTGNTIGALFVLNDITRIRRLEAVRRDFVANVSHELKTPVTSVKGFVETLLDGAMDDPQTARRFLEIISRHADRLQSIIEDLLTLSRLEQGEGKSTVVFENNAVCEVLESAAQACNLKASEKQITIELLCDKKINARINPALLEQAVINLIDNAIKYSNEKGKIEVSAAVTGDETVISVTDHGCGISDEHHSRLFERFYRVDKARSRELGGTGLGLAIVKHIAQLHGGYPDVESLLGKGSRFSIHIPV